MDGAAATTGETDVPKQPEGKFDRERRRDRRPSPRARSRPMHIQYTQEDIVGDTWVAADIGPYGMVKTTSEDMEMVLTAYGSDATTPDHRDADEVRDADDAVSGTEGQ